MKNLTKRKLIIFSNRIRRIFIVLAIIAAVLAFAGRLSAFMESYRFKNKPTGLRLVLPGPARAVQTESSREHSSGHGYYKRRDARREGK